MRDKIQFSKHSAQFVSGIVPVDVFTKKWSCALLTLTITPENDAWLDTNNHILLSDTQYSNVSIGLFSAEFYSIVTCTGL